jgi:guanylate kinase
LIPSTPEQDKDTEAVYRGLSAPRPVLVVISGPSGVGKDTTLLRLKESGHSFYFVVTATTRGRRPSEVDGVDYHFVNVGEFAEMIEQNELLEYAVVYGDYKGIPKRHVREALASGQDVIMRIDVQGAATIRMLVPNCVTIFLTAENEDELVTRLQERKTEEPDQLKMRIVTARRESRWRPGRSRRSGPQHHQSRKVPGQLDAGGNLGWKSSPCKAPSSCHRPVRRQPSLVSFCGWRRRSFHALS